jgi:hypothetical protein
MRRDGRWIVLVPLFAMSMFSACRDAAPVESEPSEPYTLEPIEGTEFSRVILTAKGAERVGIETAVVVESGGEKTVPESAVWIDVNGDEWVYTSPELLVYVRAPISVARYEGGDAVLSDGPANGTVVVSVGVPELIGSEFGV